MQGRGGCCDAVGLQVMLCVNTVHWWCVGGHDGWADGRKMGSWICSLCGISEYPAVQRVRVLPCCSSNDPCGVQGAGGCMAGQVVVRAQHAVRIEVQRCANDPVSVLGSILFLIVLIALAPSL